MARKFKALSWRDMDKGQLAKTVARCKKASWKPQSEDPSDHCADLEEDDFRDKTDA